MTELKMREAALELYKPPFRFEHGYIFDADNNMVADQHETSICRVRGWGRISYMESAEALQDECGAMIAEALTQFWNRRAEGEPSKSEPLIPRAEFEEGLGSADTIGAIRRMHAVTGFIQSAQPSAQTGAQESELFRQFAKKELSTHWLEGEEIPSSMLRLWDVWQARAALAAPAQLSDEQITTVAQEWVKETGWFEFERNDFIGCVRALLSAAQGKESGND